MNKIISFDTSACEPVDRPTTDELAGSWMCGPDVLVTVHEFELVPDLPAGLADLAVLRAALVHSAAAGGAGLIEADIIEIGGLPAVRQLIKTRIPGRTHGLAFIGAVTIPRADSSAVFKVQAVEQGITGMREALIVDRLGLDALSLMHPYAIGADLALPYNAADSAEYDPEFPEHPLTRVRTELSRLLPTIRLAEPFRARPEFTLTPAPRKRKWFGGRS
ncbi:hypothetical protein [Yinghuangia soli]|uniref:Uncharacterized protein n=1 Tax=Yinghuangia soli TaxID=2908204 RepID=A0AA41Q764_9ACTN|nr:hypothetical protein [Yinghuangia soli]MCF2532833.1 hypothetical protein [Yinghuangia soli]